MSVTYKLNASDFSSVFGITVTDSKGIIDAPRLKKPLTVNIPNIQGEIVDLSEVYYEPKTITLSCFMQATSNVNFEYKMGLLRGQLLTPGLKRLYINIGDTEPLVYQVYAPYGIEVSKKWRDSGNVYGEFDLKLTEPQPLKKVLKYTGAALTINWGTNVPLIHVSWGDGSVDTYYNSVANPTHSYAENATYYIIITGNIDSLNIVSLGGATTIWTRYL